MKYTGILLILAAAALTAACTKLPPMTDVDDDVRELREQYLSTHPDGKFNDNIKRGEVARGMHVVEVLAAWGLPNMRWGVQHSPSSHWSYFIPDDVTGMTVGYELVFEDRVLVRWFVSKGGDVIGFSRRESTRARESTGFTASGGALSGDKKRR